MPARVRSAVILAGGRGQRLSGITGDATPKALVMIEGAPFLTYHLRWLAECGVERVCLAVGYLADRIVGLIGYEFEGMEIVYSREETPLGTGGAMQKAMEQLGGNQPVFISNGDSFMRVDIPAMLQQHVQAHARLTLAVQRSADCSAGGEVCVDASGARAAAFLYPGRKQPGYISLGAYIAQPDVFAAYDLPEAFSFEADFKRLYCAQLEPALFVYEGPFLDIGVPERFAQAGQWLREHRSDKPG